MGMTGNFGQMTSNGDLIQDYNNEKVLVSKTFTQINYLFNSK